MGEDVYTRLREFLDKLPAGYPATDTGVEIRILKKLFTPEDAEIAMKLKFELEEVPDLARHLGLSEAEAAEKLEDMAMRGLIFRVRRGEKTLYMAFQFIVGIYEFQLKHMDREFAELMEEYFPYLGMSLLPIETKQMRIAPVHSAVDATPAVASYNHIPELVKSQDFIAVASCICRKERELLDQKCDRPRDLCFLFGDFGRYYLDNRMAREITADEALKLFKLAEESGLVLSPTNSQNIEAICCCCGCCCGQLSGLKMLPNPADYVASYYTAVIDPEACTACGVCLERCQIIAIEEKDDVMEVNPARCIGCGLCVSTCPAEAIKLEAKPGAEAPPVHFEEVFQRIASERGLE